MQKFSFQKEQKAVYVETQDFDVIAEDYEQAKAIAMEMLDKPLEDSDNIVVGKWELSHNSFQPYPVEMNNGHPTISILGDGGTLLSANTQIEDFDYPNWRELDDWWSNLTEETKDVFSQVVTDCYQNPERLIEENNGNDLYQIFWEKLLPEHRTIIYRYWRIKTSRIPLTFDQDREITIELAGELADYCLVHAYGMELEEMADPNGGYLDPYMDSFNSYYDDIEDGLMNHQF